MTITPPSARTRRDHGFTLVELLIVIVILGVLSGVVVFAVGGITSRGEENATKADLRNLQTAQEAYKVDNGTYASEAQLVAANLLRTESELHDVTIANDGTITYTAVDPNAPTTTTATTTTVPAVTTTTVPAEPLNVAQTTTFAGFPALRYGTGAKTLVFLETKKATARSQYEAWVAANPPIADTQFIFITSGLNSVADVETAIAQGATAWVGTYDFNNTYNGVVTNIFYLRAVGWGTQRSPGLNNVIQWDLNTESVTVVANNFVANY